MLSLENDVKRPVARKLRSLGLTPNSLSLLGILLCCFASLVLVTEVLPLWVSGILFLVGCTADLFDGALARLDEGKHDLRFGAWLDTVADKISETVLLLALYLYLSNPTARFLTSLVIASTLLTSFAKASAGEKGIILNWGEVQWFGHAGRVTIIGIGLIVASLIPVDPRSTLITTVSFLLGFNLLSLSERVIKIAVSRRKDVGKD